MKGSRFSVCVHIMTLLTQFESEYLTSEFIAASINMNPAMVRKEVVKLKKSGLVESKEGKSGGVRLARPSNQINFSDIFLADHQDGENVLSLYKNDPHEKCVIGSQIQDRLSDLFAEVDQAILDKLSGITLADFHAQFV